MALEQNGIQDVQIKDLNKDEPKMNGSNGSPPNNILAQRLSEKFQINIDGRINVRTDLDNSFPVVTICEVFSKAVKLCKDKVALSWRVGDEKVWRHMTFGEYYERTITVAKAFLKLGLKRHQAVCILGFNSPEWFISELAGIYAGGVAAGIYTTNSPEACYHCLSTSKANIVVVEDDKQLAKILEIKDRLPELKAIIQYTGQVKQPGVISWEELLELGKKESEDQLSQVMKTIVANECCVLVYTSGTVGNPKAVMICHDNIIYNAAIVVKYIGLEEDKEVIVSYLPLSHVAAQVIDIFTGLYVRAQCFFADRNALKGSLIETLREVQPTRFLGVPRVWEKIQEKMLQVGANNGYFKKMIANWAKAQGLQHNLNNMEGSPTYTWGYSVANALVFKKVKQALGFGRCQGFFSAAAPISTETKRYFLSLDILILELFGMSETAGGHSANNKDCWQLEGIGRTIPGVKTKIDNPDAEGNGEICLMGRHIFMGYLDDLEKTKETIDEEGWLHSGDIGRIDDRGFLYITGRIKELLITAGGENIAPVLIEHKIKQELPHISNAVVIGDKRKFLAILLSLKTEVEPENGSPLDELTEPCARWLESLGCPAKTVPEVIEKNDPKLRAAIQEAIDKVNKEAISNAQRVQKFTILPKDFSIPTGELGPTLKLKRNVVTQKYAELIESFYA